MRFLLHPHRAEILAACALVMRQAEPLPEGLSRLAADDLLLQPWVKRLAPPLRCGTPLPETLRAAGLLSRSECSELSAEPDLAKALDRLASSVLAPPRWTWLIRHFPLVLCCVLVGTTFLGKFLFTGAQIMKDLNLGGGGFQDLLAHPWQLALGVGLAVGGMAVGDWLIRSLRGVRHIAHLWCPEIARQQALLQMLQAARRDDRRPQPLQGVRLLLARMRIGAWRYHRPAWDLQWRTWMFLTRFRLDRTQRRAAMRQEDLTQRLLTLGLVDLDRGRPDWEAAEADCLSRLATAEAELLLLLRPVLLWGFLTSVLMVTLGPLLQIIYELGRMT